VVDVDRTDARVRPMTAADLAIVLQWRNHPDVRRHMYTTHDISAADHRQWFERELADVRSHLLILEIDQVPRGFIKFKETGAGVADWGFYAAPDAPAGTGRSLGRTALAHAFTRLALHKVCGQAFARNERSIRFHEHQGFSREGVLREQHFDGQSYQDVVCFGLLADEWKRANDGAGDGH
jgi:UDP-4-amino-4,6-dideoxy-N-acetyl-beta-L-altrosamine N-acetyltransferase